MNAHPELQTLLGRAEGARFQLWSLIEVLEDEHFALRAGDDTWTVRDQLAHVAAVLPASFNPPTVAHAELLARAKDVAGVASSAALLTTRNVDKGMMGAGYADRLGMLLSLDLAGTGVLISNAARIADQAAALRASSPAERFDFLVGYDTLVRLFDHRYYHGDLHEVLAPYFAHHRLIAATRREFDVGAIERFLLATPDAHPYGDRILPLDLDDNLMFVSSSAVREHIDGGVAVDVPPGVRAYIREHRLYGSHA